MTKLAEAQAFADDFLFPTANDVDAMDVLPRERLDRLAADGWYGLACAFGPEHVQHWAAPMASGDIRSSVAFNGLLPNPKLRSRPDGDSWVIDGTAPWMSGWGLVDVIHCATRAQLLRGFGTS